MKHLITLAVLAAVAWLGTAEVRYDGFQVIQVTPRTEDQVESLRQMQDVSSYSFWTGVAGVDHTVDILVSPQQKYDFQDIVRNLDLEWNVMIQDVQVLIDQEKVPVLKSGEAYNWKNYLTLDQLHDWLRNFAAQNQGVVTLVNGGRSYEGRDLLGVKISFGAGKKAVVLEAGIHAREWIAPATVTYIANQLVNSQDPAVRAVAERYDWHVFPSVNPDGYVYTHTTNRIWRKTRKPYGFCFGADPNRNWGYKWLQGGASNQPCLDTYAGSGPFSEVETKSLSEYISTIIDNLEGYIAFHSYSQILLIPYGHSGLEVPSNNQEMHQIARSSVNALARRYGTQYTFGNVFNAIYVASGGSMDWVLNQNKNIRVAYTYELRDKGRHGFLLPPDQIIPTGEETLDSLINIFEQL